MKKWKKLLMSFLVFVFSILAGWGMGSVNGVKAESYNEYKYFVCNNETIEIYGYSGSETELVIPGEIDGKKVTEIGCNRRRPFLWCSGLTSIVIPDSVTTIGARAFQGCSSLTSIVIPDSVTSIGARAFQGCSSLTSIVIPDSVTSIEENAFSGCSGLTNITIPENVTSIKSPVFSGCSSLTSITVDEKNTVYDSREDCNAIIETKTNTLVRGCCNTTIPESVPTIGDSAFSGGSSLMSITIPESVTRIGIFGRLRDDPFSGCSSIKVDEKNAVYDSREDCNAIIETKTNTLVSGCCNTTIPDSVTTIGACAFQGCSGLTSIVIPDSVTTIGACAFQGCSGLTSIVIPDSVTSIEENAFSGCSGLTNITIPESVTEIGMWVFGGCSGLEKIVVDERNTVYDSREDCNAIIITEGNVLIKGCRNTTIPSSVVSIGVDAFSDSGLTSITIPSSVTKIAEYAFCPDNLVIWTTRNSYAVIQYARTNKITVKYIGESEEPTGTPNPSPTPTGTVNPNPTTSPSDKPVQTSVPVSSVSPTSTPAAGPGTEPTSEPGATPTGDPSPSSTQTPDSSPTTPPGGNVDPAPTPAAPQPPAQVQPQPQSPGTGTTPAREQKKPTKSGLAIKGGAKAKAGKKKLALAWKKVANASGYEIQISLKKNFKGAKKQYVKGAKKNITIKQLKSGTVYYIRIRAYTEQNGKKIYGKWTVSKKKVK